MPWAAVGGRGRPEKKNRHRPLTRLERWLSCHCPWEYRGVRARPAIRRALPDASRRPGLPREGCLILSAAERRIRQDRDDHDGQRHGFNRRSILAVPRRLWIMCVLPLGTVPVSGSRLVRAKGSMRPPTARHGAR